MCIRLNIDCDYLLLFYPTHVFIGVYFPGIIISRSKFHVEHRMFFKVKTTTRMTACTGLSSPTRNGTHFRDFTRRPDFQQTSRTDNVDTEDPIIKNFPLIACQLECTIYDVI